MDFWTSGALPSDGEQTAIAKQSEGSRCYNPASASIPAWRFMSSLPPSNRCCLFLERIPSEIRLRIYSAIFETSNKLKHLTHPKKIDTRELLEYDWEQDRRGQRSVIRRAGGVYLLESNQVLVDTAILTVNKTISGEALQVLSKTCIFRITPDELFLGALTKKASLSPSAGPLNVRKFTNLDLLCHFEIEISGDDPPALPAFYSDLAVPGLIKALASRPNIQSIVVGAGILEKLSEQAFFIMEERRTLHYSVADFRGFGPLQRLSAGRYRACYIPKVELRDFRVKELWDQLKNWRCSATHCYDHKTEFWSWSGRNRQAHTAAVFGLLGAGAMTCCSWTRDLSALLTQDRSAMLVSGYIEVENSKREEGIWICIAAEHWQCLFWPELN